MSIMGYCRHEVALQDLQEVWEKWRDFSYEEASIYELRARLGLIELIKNLALDLDLEYETEQVNEQLNERKP